MTARQKAGLLWKGKYMKSLLNAVYGYRGGYSINDRYYLNKNCLFRIGNNIIRGFHDPIPPHMESFANTFMTHLISQNDTIRNYKKNLGIYVHK